MSLLVPVLTAEKRVASGLSKPNVRTRALLSERMSVTTKLAASLNTRVPSAARAGDASDAPAAPDAGAGTSMTLRATPPFASARYALVSDSSVTSALPSARLKP